MTSVSFFEIKSLSLKIVFPIMEEQMFQILVINYIQNISEMKKMKQPKSNNCIIFRGYSIREFK